MLMYAVSLEHQGRGRANRKELQGKFMKGETVTSTEGFANSACPTTEEEGASRTTRSGAPSGCRSREGTLSILSFRVLSERRFPRGGVHRA